MAFLLMDDDFWTNPKLERLSDRAFRAYWRSLGYASKHLTDGLIDRTALRTLGIARKTATELVSAGCWVPVSDGGYQVHDYLEHNPSREQVQAKRKLAAERQAKRRAVANHDPASGRWS